MSRSFEMAHFLVSVQVLAFFLGCNLKITLHTPGSLNLCASVEMHSMCLLCKTLHSYFYLQAADSELVT